MNIRRLTFSLLITLLLATFVSAQENDDKSGPADLTVLKHSWHKEFAGLAATSNPLQPNEDLMRQTRAEKQVIRDRDYRLPNQTTELPMPVPGPKPVPPDSKSREFYVYQVTLKNNGAKQVRKILWEFQFLHPETQEVLGSKRITSRVKLSPGKTEEIKAKLFQQPTHIVPADQLGKKYKDQFKEQVIIHGIDYADGSTWQRRP
jgi:hypothetical protein